MLLRGFFRESEPLSLRDWRRTIEIINEMRWSCVSLEMSILPKWAICVNWFQLELVVKRILNSTYIQVQISRSRNAKVTLVSKKSTTLIIYAIKLINKIISSYIKLDGVASVCLNWGTDFGVVGAGAIGPSAVNREVKSWRF